MRKRNGRRGLFDPTSQLGDQEGEHAVVELIRWWRCSGKAPSITYSGSRDGPPDKSSISRPGIIWSVFLELLIAVELK